MSMVKVCKTIYVRTFENVIESHLELPVKLMPARCGELVMTSPNTGPSAGTKLITPGGTPASRKIL